MPARNVRVALSLSGAGVGRRGTSIALLRSIIIRVDRGMIRDREQLLEMARTTGELQRAIDRALK
ncbi:MAG TPA: hypothetical protein VNN79_15470 [Actinomycetota bacterium]|nr:hypothetical protein [Actinomycetota bacterium]